MSAPTKDSLKSFLVAAMIKGGLVENEYNGQGQVVPAQPVHITPHMDKLLSALSEGICNQWQVWEASQSVTVVGVTPGTGAVTTPGPVALS